MPAHPPGARLLVHFTDSTPVARRHRAPSAAWAVDAERLTDCRFLLFPLNFALCTDSHLSQGLGDPRLWSCCPPIVCLLVIPAPCWGCCHPCSDHRAGPFGSCSPVPGPVPGPRPRWLLRSHFSFWSPTSTSSAWASAGAPQARSLFRTQPSSAGLFLVPRCLLSVCLRPAPTQTGSPGGRDRVCPTFWGSVVLVQSQHIHVRPHRPPCPRLAPKSPLGLGHQCWEWGIWQPPLPPPSHRPWPSRWPPGAPCCQ